LMERYLYPALFLVVFVAAWEFLPSYFGLPNYVLPKLSEIGAVFADVSRYGQFAYGTYVTLKEALLGVLIGGGLGLVIGFALAESRILMNTFYPYIVALQCVPKVAIAPLLVIWFGFGIASKVIIASLLCFFPVLVSTISGIRSVRDDYAELFHAIKAPRLAKLRHLVIPSALPSIFSGMEIGLTIALLGAIVGEFVGAQEGLGVLLMQAQFQMDTPSVFAILGILSFLGIVLSVLVHVVRKKSLYWVSTENDISGR
jgi:NitT/TauT family transport system permease protein